MRKILLTAFCAALAAAAFGQSKLDLQSQMELYRLRNTSIPTYNSRTRTFERRQSVPQNTMAMIELKNGNGRAELEAEGVTVLRMRGGIAIAVVPLADVERISALKCVHRMELPRRMYQKMDIVRKEIGVDKIHQGIDLPQAYTGKGVVTGIVDGGIDPNHINFLKPDGSVSFAVSGSPMVVHLGFDPKTLAFSLKGGDLLSTTPRGSASLLRVTSVWDKSFYIALQKAISQVESQHNAGKISDADYDQFNQSTLPGIYSIFASKNLSMTAAMMASEEDGVVMGLFEDSGTNAAYMSQQTGLAQMGFPVDSFDANTLGIYEYLLSGKKLTFRRPMVMLMVPVFYHPLPSAGGAKPSLPHLQKAGISLPTLKALLR